jgi:hypothetical protein
MMLSPSYKRDLNTAYAFFERNWNLIRRYLGWEVVWIIYSLVSALTILFIAEATESITGQPVNTDVFVLYLLIGTTMWSYLSAVFDVVAETIAWERWEGTIESYADGASAASFAPARYVLFRGHLRHVAPRSCSWWSRSSSDRLARRMCRPR